MIAERAGRALEEVRGMPSGDERRPRCCAHALQRRNRLERLRVQNVDATTHAE